MINEIQGRAALSLIASLVAVGCMSCDLTRTELPAASYSRPPEASFTPSDYVFKLEQLASFYDVPGEFGHVMEGDRYGFDSLSLIITATHPGGGPPLHRHETEEAHVLYEGTASYVIGDRRFTVTGPYVARVPAGMPHTFVNVGDRVFHLVAIFPTGKTTYTELGMNPLVKGRE